MAGHALVRPQVDECGSLDSRAVSVVPGSRRGQRSPGVQGCGSYFQAWLVGLPTAKSSSLRSFLLSRADHGDSALRCRHGGAGEPSAWPGSHV